MTVNNRIIVKYCLFGAYAGNKALYQKRVSPYFESHEKALTYKQCYGAFSLSLSDGLPKKVEICL